MPLYVEPSINDQLVTLAMNYLQTRDPKYFPFAAEFDDARREAFVRDLRIGLSDLTESGAKRGTSSTGFLTSDKRLRTIIRDWAEAEGGWPKGQDPFNPDGVGGVAWFDDDDDEPADAPAGVMESV